MDKLKWQKKAVYNMAKMSFTLVYQMELYGAQKGKVSVRKMKCCAELSKGLGVKEKFDELSNSQKK